MYGVYTEACVRREIAALIGVGPKLHIISDAGRDRRTESFNLPRKIAAARRPSCSPSPS